MIVRWLMANTKAIEERHRDGKTYYVMVDPKAFREGVGRLLAEVQRIKSEGDAAAAAKTVRHLRHSLRPEAARRGPQARGRAEAAGVHRLRDAKLTPVTDSSGKITDVKILYPQDLTTQMLEYSSLTK
jgi:dipeptidyl-peptidase-3